MKNHFLALSLFVFTLIAIPTHQAWSQSQNEMTQGAAKDFEKADAQLNAIYKKVIATLDEEGKKKLIKAQKAWIAFRDAQAEFVADEMRGGSASPMLLYGSKASISAARVKELKQYLDDHKNQ